MRIMINPRQLTFLLRTGPPLERGGELCPVGGVLYEKLEIKDLSGEDDCNVTLPTSVIQSFLTVRRAKANQYIKMKEPSSPKQKGLLSQPGKRSRSDTLQPAARLYPSFQSLALEEL